MGNSVNENYMNPNVMEDRRSDSRHRYEMNIKLQILFPEETFTPIIYTCRSHDLSLKGMRIALDQLPLSQYAKLLAKSRYARISFMNDIKGEVIKLTGKIVWIDYRKPKATEQGGLCYMAVALEDRDNQDYIRFTEFVQCIVTHSSVMV